MKASIKQATRPYFRSCRLGRIYRLLKVTCPFAATIEHWLDVTRSGIKSGIRRSPVDVGSAETEDKGEQKSDDRKAGGRVAADMLAMFDMRSRDVVVRGHDGYPLGIGVLVMR